MTDDAKGKASWPDAFADALGGYGCLVIVLVFLALSFSSQVINIIQAIHGR